MTNGDSIALIFLIAILVAFVVPIISYNVLMIMQMLRLYHQKKKALKQMKKFAKQHHINDIQKALIRMQYLKSIEDIIGKPLNVDISKLKELENKHCYQVTPEFTCVSGHELTEEEKRLAKEMAEKIINMIKREGESHYDSNNSKDQDKN